eukprot:TRINITY_DN5076_c0_g1_i1.p1 TRINITY_DN5076_c0_g1~~TRINITY_DN5076_c0_g1_i1.p1  ORF type:complete len:151 (+),score=33.83 TRINITY_DN5076_c0_g1_i1:180-632(+)
MRKEGLEDLPQDLQDMVNKEQSEFDNTVECFRCKEEIYGMAIRVQGNIYHEKCYVCSFCKKELNNLQAVEHRGLMYCKGCAGDVSSSNKSKETCSNCEKAFEKSDQYYSANEKKFHPKCFVCYHCKSLLTKGYSVKNDQICCPLCTLKKK